MYISFAHMQQAYVQRVKQKNIKSRYRLTEKTLKDMLWHLTNSHRPSYFVICDNVRVIDIIKPQ